MIYLDRHTWGATVPTAGYGMRLPAVGVHVHHSVTIADDDHSLESTADVAADMRDVEAIGAQRFGRFPYSFCIHPSGVVAEGAGLTVGAHTADWNSTTFGVCFIGNYEHDALTDAQVAAFGELYRHLVVEQHLRADAWIVPHRDRKATACPGEHTVERWSDLLDSTLGGFTVDTAAKVDAIYAFLFTGLNTPDDATPGADHGGHALLSMNGVVQSLPARLDAVAAAAASARLDVDAVAATVAAKVGAGPVNLEVSGAELADVIAAAIVDALRAHPLAPS